MLQASWVWERAAAVKAMEPAEAWLRNSTALAQCGKFALTRLLDAMHSFTGAQLGGWKIADARAGPKVLTKGMLLPYSRMKDGTSLELLLERGGKNKFEASASELACIQRIIDQFVATFHPQR